MKKWKIALLVILAIGLIPFDIWHVETATENLYGVASILLELDFGFSSYGGLLVDISIPSCCYEWWQLGHLIPYIGATYHHKTFAKIVIGWFPFNHYMGWSTVLDWFCY